MEEIGISVIMPSYLGKYEGSRINADQKFIRAVESFQQQTLQNKELIIVSDGCEITNRIYRELFQYDTDIKLIRCEKSKAVWPGTLREVGRSMATWDWIHYLDTDDYDMQNHLLKLSKHIETRKDETLFISMKYWFPLVKEPNALYLKFISMELDKYLIEREKAIEHPIMDRIGRATAGGHFGTWQILHHKEIPHRWRDAAEMGEDKDFIQRIKTTEKWKTIDDGEHIHCHNTHAEIRKLIWDV